MKNQFFLTGVLLAGLLASTPAMAEPVPLDALLKEIKVALVQVQRSPDAGGLPPLRTATLNATTTQKRVSGGTFQLFVIEFGRKRTSELTTDVSITLSPPSVGAPVQVATPQISQALADAILAAARAIKEARTGPPRWSRARSRRV